jgi:hypothetical protein
MYSKEEASKIRAQFWINFGKYMKPIPSADGLPVNWINYKTGVKHVFFKMDAEKKSAIISIAITHPHDLDRKLYFEQFEAFKRILHDVLGEEWEWDSDTSNESGVHLAKIYKTLPNVSIYNQQDWPALISFLKPRIIALDTFWSDVKPVFEALG